jgi:hypothetical protein
MDEWQNAHARYTCRVKRSGIWSVDFHVPTVGGSTYAFGTAENRDAAIEQIKAAIQLLLPGEDVSQLMSIPREEVPFKEQG